MIVITDEAYVREFGELYQKVLKLRKDDEFDVDREQLIKFFEVYRFFTKAAKEIGDAHIEPIKLVPREEHGGITATFLVFDMYGDILEAFKEVVQSLSALTIDATDDGVCISVTVPRIFVRKKPDGEH